MHARIATLQPAHADAFAALNRAWLVEHGLLEHTDERVLGDPWGQIITPGGQVFIALLAHEVVGTCAVIPHGPGVLELAKLAVAPRARGQGLGRRLVETAIDHARRAGAQRIMLVSNSRLGAALRLYARLGFQHRPLPSPLPYATADVHMQLELRAHDAAPG